MIEQPVDFTIPFCFRIHTQNQSREGISLTYIHLMETFQGIGLCVFTYICICIDIYMIYNYIFQEDIHTLTEIAKVKHITSWNLVSISNEVVFPGFMTM